MKKKPLEIDMCAGSQLRDTQGETLSIEGADISELKKLNDNHGKGFFNSIGVVTSAKKIFKVEDCEDDRQRYYWDKVKSPYIYVRGYLHDDEDHPNAKAAAAILRNIQKHDAPLSIKSSVEGGVIARGIKDPSLLARTKIHSVALTFTPANNATLVEPISLDKSQSDEAADMLLIRSVLHLAETNVPSFRHIVRDASASKIQENLSKINELVVAQGAKPITIPDKKDIINQAVEEKIAKNVQLINEQIKQLNETALDKGIKQAVTGALTAAALASSPQQIAKEPTALQAQVKPAMVKPNHEETYSKIAKQYPVLGAIGAVESQGGKNLNHPQITGKVLQDFYGIGGGKGKSMHEGMRAGGAYGIMPLSAAFILKQDPNLAQKYPKLVEAAKDVNKNHKDITDILNSDSEVDADVAASLFNHNRGKTKSDQQLIYSWLHGLKGSWNKYKDGGKKAFNDHPYVQKVMQEYAKIKPKKVQQSKPLKKAMMAGYGGAGAPTGQSGGGVIQSESLEQGRPGFKYVTCDNCGKEQVHSKHQVKCRDCGNSFSLEKLYRTMIDEKL